MDITSKSESESSSGLNVQDNGLWFFKVCHSLS